MLLGVASLSAHDDSPTPPPELDRWIAEMPGQPAPYLKRAEHAETHQRWDAALEDVERARRLAPDSPEILRALGRIQLARQQPEQALGALDAALALAPDDVEARLLRARARALRNDAEGAYDDYSAAFRQLADPKPEMILARARLPIDPMRAAADLDRELQRRGPVPALVEQAIALHLRLGQTDAALAHLDALTACSERKEWSLKRRGDLLRAAGRPREAEQAYRAAREAVATLPDWLQRSPDTLDLSHQLNALLANVPNRPNP